LGPLATAFCAIEHQSGGARLEHGSGDDSRTGGSYVLGTALIVGGLSYFPALAMGPLVEQLMLAQ